VPGCERVPHITDTPPQIASQAFLKGIASHPVLRECQAVSTFLLAPGCLSLNPAWTYLLNPPPSAVSQGRAPCWGVRQYLCVGECVHVWMCFMCTCCT
jgi:hypothetical protein